MIAAGSHYLCPRSPGRAPTRSPRRFALALSAALALLAAAVLTLAAAPASASPSAPGASAVARSGGFSAIPAPKHHSPHSEAAISLTPSSTKPHWACPEGACEAVIDPRPAHGAHGYALPQGPLLEGGGELGGFDPQDLQSAYKIPTALGSQQTIALVDAYGYAAAESDLAVYRQKYGLEPCTKANGCFKKVNEKGEEGKYPANNKEWESESALDLDMASAACPKCHLLLVEATTELPADTGESVNTAAKLGASEISNSYGYPEDYEPWCGTTGCAEYSKDYKQAGVVVTASAGDYGYNDHFAGLASPDFPATSPNVIAVGGTSLRKAANSRGWSEEVWNEPPREIGTGSGCSGVESKPTWQTDKACSKRMDDDVAAVAAVETPVSVYSSPNGGWGDYGGTSASSPLLAGIEAHASAHTRSLGALAFYEDPGSLFDVTIGSNGTCTPPTEDEYFCNAGIGYDGPTGLGTPDGIASSPPAVATQPASSVTQTSAALNATVNPNGGVVSECKLEYGTTSSYGSSIACSSLPGSGESPVAVSASATGLAANTLYHFRINATNAGGTSTGSDQTFTTLLPNPPTFATSFAAPNNLEGSFKEPDAVAVDPSGNIWVADSGHDRVLEFNSKREYLRQFGTEGTAEGQFEGIAGIAANSSGDVYVSGSDRVQEFSPSGAFIRQFGSPGSGNGQFLYPNGIAVDSSGNVWVLDTFNYRVQEFSPSGAYLGQFGSAGTGNGQLGWASGLAFSGGNLYVADSSRVEEFSTAGTYLAQFGSSGTGNGQFHGLGGITTDPTTGDLYVSDVYNNRVQEFSAAGAFIAAFGTAGSGPGQFSAPRGVAVNSSGTLYVADAGNSRVQEWLAAKVAGEPPTFAISFTPEKIEGSLKEPDAVALDPSGNIWVADSGHDRVLEFNSKREYLRQFGTEGTGEGQFEGIAGIAANSSGDVYVSGSDRVQEFSPAGEFLRQWGSPGSGNGQFLYPTGIAVDASGNVWVLDTFNYRVQEFSPSGEYLGQFGSKGTGNGQLGWASGLAFSGGNLCVADSARVEEFSTSGTYLAQFGSSGTGNGQFHGLGGIATDPTTGDLYVSDVYSNRVQEFSAAGAFIAAFGSGGSGNGQFSAPRGVAVNSSGTLYVADAGNNRLEEWVATP